MNVEWQKGNFMRFIYIILVSFCLAACSIQGMVESAVPENVRADHAAHIDALLETDTSRIVSAFDVNPDDPEAKAVLTQILANVPDGTEIRRDYVSMQTSSRVSIGEGKSRDINLATEVQTTDGFMLVTTDYALNSSGECCVLTNLNVNAFDSSPVRAGLETFIKIAKIAGGIILIGIAALVFFLIRRRRRRKAA